MRSKTLYLLCNAHLDPVWLWEWEEGAAEALSTFRMAARFQTLCVNGFQESMPDAAVFTATRGGSLEL